MAPKHMPLPRGGTLAHRSEYPRKDAEVVSRDTDNLKASKTSLCLCLNSAGSSGDRNQSSFVSREELKMAQETLPEWAPASFSPPKTSGAPWHIMLLLIPAWQVARLGAPVSLMSHGLPLLVQDNGPYRPSN